MKWYPFGHDFGNAEIGGVTLLEYSPVSRSIPTAFAIVDTTALRGLGIDTTTSLILRLQTEEISYIGKSNGKGVRGMNKILLSLSFSFYESTGQVLSSLSLSSHESTESMGTLLSSLSHPFRGDSNDSNQLSWSGGGEQ